MYSHAYLILNDNNLGARTRTYGSTLPPKCRRREGIRST